MILEEDEKPTSTEGMAPVETVTEVQRKFLFM
ncbi:MAG: hypothetical protein CM1200mP28_04930 [Deltaproteobacteria bacterium]|nr:MAG: hypothetical protein CM1200mP28_04930 [Deltaproteobacteria bacterium]